MLNRLGFCASYTNINLYEASAVSLLNEHMVRADDAEEFPPFTMPPQEEGSMTVDDNDDDDSDSSSEAILCKRRRLDLKNGKVF